MNNIEHMQVAELDFTPVPLEPPAGKDRPKPAPDREKTKEALAQLGWELRTQRQALGLTQTTVGTRAGSKQALVSEVECAKRNVSVQTLLHLGAAVGMELMWVPKDVRPAVENFVNQLR